MNTKIIISLVLCALTATAANAVNEEEDVQIAFQRLDTLLQSYKTYMAADAYSVRAFDNADDVTDQCFDYHIPKSTEIMKTYQLDTETCKSNSQAAKDAQAILNAEKRTDLTNRGNKVTEDLDICASITDTLEFLKCYEAASASNAQALYKVADESSDQLNVVKIKYEEIDNAKTLCTSSARRKYTTDTAANDKAMQSCLMGETTPPTESTTAATTPEETTEETTETTTETTTEATPEPTTVVTTEATTEEVTEEVTEETTGEPVTEATTEEVTESTEEPTEVTEVPTDEPEVETDEPETEQERSPEEDIYLRSKSAQARRKMLNSLLH